MTMGDRIAVMRVGELQQLDTPADLYDHPVNIFVAGFIGSPSMNIVEATIERANGGIAVALGTQKLELDEGSAAGLSALEAYEGRPVIAGIRPEHLDDVSLEPDTPARPAVARDGRAPRGARLGADGALHASRRTAGRDGGDG